MSVARPIASIVAASPVIPVVTITDVAHAVPLAKALVRGGIRVVEVTLRTAAALKAIEAIAKEVPEILLGVGTVLKASRSTRRGARGRRVCDLARINPCPSCGGERWAAPLSSRCRYAVRDHASRGSWVRSSEVLSGCRVRWDGRVEGLCGAFPFAAVLSDRRDFSG